jgi:hypothetical protein
LVFFNITKQQSMKQLKNISLASLVVLLVVTAGCDKTKLYDLKTPEPQAHFVGAATQTYSILVNPAPAYVVRVGTTDVSNADRTVTINVTSPTGATAGNQFTLGGTGAGNTITIKAGKAIDSFTVTANYTSYTAGRKDTLVFTIAEPSVKSAAFLEKVSLVLRGPCFEGDIDATTLAGLRGSYLNSRETFGTSPYGPYATTIPTATLTSLTTATIVVTNVWDNGWGPLTFNLDWTNPTPGNITATVVPVNAIPGSNAADIGGTGTISVRPFAGNPGTFSACTSVFTLRMQLGFTGGAFRSELYTLIMRR